MRMPGRSSGEPMNSMPAASSADLMALRLAKVLTGAPPFASIRLIVLMLTEEACASTSMLQPKAARALRI